MCDAEGGIEVMPAEVRDGSAGADAAGFARAAVGADGLVARERAVAHRERSRAGADNSESDGVDRGAAPAVAGVAARAARAADGLVSAERAMGEREHSAGAAARGGEQAAAVGVAAF